MPALLSLGDARGVLREDVLGPEELRMTFGLSDSSVPPIPLSSEELLAAAQRGEILVLRSDHSPDGAPLTIMSMAERFPQAFDQKLLRQMGYQLKEEWGIALEPLAATETCAAGWAMIGKDILADSRNLTYDEQDVCVRRYAAGVAAPTAAIRRRTAVEAVFDTVVYFTARQRRLLAQSWDWSASRTVDGGYLNVGGFGPAGIQVLSFSRGIRHGALGVCPTRQGWA
jgi:hypothetical protein